MNKNDMFLGVSGNLKLLSPYGRKVNVSTTEISRQDRTASGRLVKDIITTKKKFTLSYSLIDGNDLQIFLDLYALETSLVLTIAPYAEYTVLMEPIDYSRVIATGDGLWSGVSVELNEV
jgi:hypothetical protein